MTGPLHVVVITYTAGLDEIDAVLGEHRAWLDANYADGTFVTSGPRDPRVGGVILAGGVGRAELDRRLGQDPFNLHGLAEYAITTFTPSRTASGAPWG